MRLASTNRPGRGHSAGRVLLLTGVLAGLLVGSLTGCSQTEDDPGTASGADGVRSALGRIETGLLDGDGALACSFLQGTAQRSFNATAGSSTCPDSVAAASASIEKQSAALEDLSDTEIEVDGDRAVLSGAGADAFADLLGQREVVLSRYQGVWMVE